MKRRGEEYDNLAELVRQYIKVNFEGLLAQGWSYHQLLRWAHGYLPREHYLLKLIMETDLYRYLKENYGKAGASMAKKVCERDKVSDKSSR